MAANGSSNIQVHPLFYKLFVQSNGSNAVWREYEIDASAMTNVGASTAGVTLHTRSEASTANVEWKVAFHWSLDGNQWEGPFDFFSTPVGADGQMVHPEFTDKSKLGIKLRVVVAVKNSTGTAIESAMCSGVAVCRFIS